MKHRPESAGIPLVAVLVPDRTQAAMISMMDECPKGFDPYKLGNELRSIIVSHGGTYIDILPEFRTYPILNSVTSRSMDIPMHTGKQ